MSVQEFDAFALPAGLDAGETAVAAEEGGVRLRMAAVSPEWIRGVADALFASRSELLDRPGAEIVEALGRVGARFLDAGDPVRAEALTLLPNTAHVSPEMAEVVLDGMATDWTADRLRELVRRELGGEDLLDGFGTIAALEEAAGTRGGQDRRFAVFGPALCTQIVAGSVPGVSVTAMLRSLLLKGPTLVKPGRGDVVLPTLFARALREADPGLADSVAVVYWPGGEPALDAAALERADVVTVYGSDETVAAVRARCPATARLVGYHHRVSVGIVGRDAVAAPDELRSTAAEVAWAAALFEQRGCVSPQVVFVEADAPRVEEFARALGDALGDLEDQLPSAPLDAAESSRLHQMRGSVELLAAAGEATVVHGGGAPWTVVFGPGPLDLGSAAGRTLRVRSVEDVDEVPPLLAPLRTHLQTVGVAGVGARLEALARVLGSAGASRVVPFSAVPFPPPWWHHDGRGPLQELVRWVDLEEEGYSS